MLLYRIPNFIAIWNNISKTKDFANFKKEGWLKLSKGGKNYLVTKLNLYKIKNINSRNKNLFESLSKDQKMNLSRDIKSKNIQMPIIVEYKNKSQKLISGESLLYYSISKYGKCPAWKILL